jgi:microcystin-dependent protein
MAQDPFIGSIFIFAGNFAPNGYQLCQGQLMSISQNAALFSILGTTYGGDGVQTFGLPDLRGRAPIGQGNGPGLNGVVLGQLAGTQSVSILTSNLPAHNHLVSVSTGLGAQASPQNGFIAAVVDSTGAGGASFNTTANPPATLAPTSVGLTGSNLPLSIQNPYLGINYIIAINGIYPSRS